MEWIQLVLFSLEGVCETTFARRAGENMLTAVNLLTSWQIILSTYQGNMRGQENLRELSEQLVQKVAVKKLQLANKTRKMDGSNLEETLDEERLVMVTFYREDQAR